MWSVEKVRLLCTLAAAVEMTESILKDKKKILPSLLTWKGRCINGLTLVFRANRRERSEQIIEINLTPRNESRFRKALRSSKLINVLGI